MLLSPNAPDVVWANSLDEDGPRFEDEDDPTDDPRQVFLIPDIEEPGAAAKYVDKHFNLLALETVPHPVPGRDSSARP